MYMLIEKFRRKGFEENRKDGINLICFGRLNGILCFACKFGTSGIWSMLEFTHHYCSFGLRMMSSPR